MLIQVGLHMNMAQRKITPKQYWQIQVRNARYKLELQKNQNLDLKQMLTVKSRITNAIISNLEANKTDEVFNLLIDANFNLTNETYGLEQCKETTDKYHNLLFQTVGDLTSKDKKWGEPRTPEMGEYWLMMQSHCQMHSKQCWHHYDKFTQNFRKEKPDTAD